MRQPFDLMTILASVLVPAMSHQELKQKAVTVIDPIGRN